MAATAGCAVDRIALDYDDVFAARAQDAVDRGWVPEWLPEGSTDLRTLFEPRDGQSLFAATLGDDRTSLDDACDEPLPDDLSLPSLDAAWFDRDVAAATTPMACDDGRLVVVDGDRVLAWTPPGVVPSEPDD